MTATPLLNITQIAPSQNNKETTINDALLALENAGQATLAVSLTSADATLTTAQFTRYARFACSGNSVSRNLIVPLSQRQFIVMNGGSAALVVKGATGATVVIPATTSMVIYCDGTDCTSASAGSGGSTALSTVTQPGSTDTVVLNSAGGSTLTGEQISMVNFASAIGSLLAAISLVSPPATSIYQRTSVTGGPTGSTANLGQGPVSVSVTIVNGVTSLEYRTVDSTSGTALMSWVSASGALTSGTTTLILNIPACTNWQTIQVRANGASISAVSVTNAIAVGDVSVLAGQSLASFGLSAYNASTYVGSNTFPSGMTANAATSVYGNYALSQGGSLQNPSAVAWGSLSSGTFYGSSFAVEYLNRMVTATGVAQALVAYGIGGSTIANWQSGQANNTALKSAITTAAIGRFSAFLWMQGHDDGNDSSSQTQSGYQTALTSMISDLASTFSSASFVRVLLSIPGIKSGGDNSVYTTPSKLQMIRAAHLAYVAANSSTSVYVAALDCALYSSVHPSQASGNVTLARHFYRAVLGKRGLRSTTVLGPQITSANARTSGTSPTIVLNVTQQSGATAFQSVGTASSQFRVFNSGGTATEYTVTGCDLTVASQITLTISSPPADTQALDVYYRYPLDTTTALGSAIYDNITDSDSITAGRILQMTAGATTASAVVVSTGTLTGSAVTEGTAATFTWALTGTTTGYACLSVGGVDETGSTVTGSSGTVSLTPAGSGSYVAKLYTASGGTLLATTSVFSVAATGGFAGTSGLIAWFRPSDTKTVTQVSGSVTQVDDISGNSYNMTRPSGAKPTLVSSAINSLPALNFDGSSQALNLDALAAQFSGSNPTMHFFAVVETAGGYSSVTWPTYFSFGQQDITPKISGYINGGGSFGFADATAFAENGSGGAPTAGTYYIVEGTYNSSTGVLNTYINQATNYTATHAAASPTITTGRVGCLYNGSSEARFYPGRIAELAFVKGGIITGTTRSTLLTYLNTRYALGLTIV